MKQNKYQIGDINTLLHIILEEWTANGNAFVSPDSDLWLRQRFGDDWTNGDESTSDILRRLIKDNNEND